MIKNAQSNTSVYLGYLMVPTQHVSDSEDCHSTHKTSSELLGIMKKKNPVLDPFKKFSIS